MMEMMMSDETPLRECPNPWCGCAGAIIGHRGKWWGQCRKDTMIHTPKFDTAAEAIAAWNTRAPEPRLAALEAENAELRARVEAAARLGDLYHTPPEFRPTTPEAEQGDRITPEWCLKMAELEGDQEIGAGLLALDPTTDCPHAQVPFRYCDTCPVSPCPLGLADAPTPEAHHG